MRANRIAASSTLVLILGLSSPVFAQRDAGSKAMGDFGRGFWASQSVSRHIDHASDYVVGLQDYVSNASTIDVDIAQAHSEEVNRNLAAVSKEIETLKKHIPAGDKESASKAETAAKHLRDAAQRAKAIHEQCSQAGADPKAIHAQCQSVLDSLKKVQAEHDALVQRLFPTKK